MKKLFIAACMLFGISAAASAQAPAVTTAPAATTTEMKVVKKHEATGKVVKMKHEKAPKAASMTKADGTADMRFKANKGAKAAPAAGPLKKDGTADMRYKANKKKKA